MKFETKFLEAFLVLGEIYYQIWNRIGRENHWGVGAFSDSDDDEDVESMDSEEARIYRKFSKNINFY